MLAIQPLQACVTLEPSQASAAVRSPQACITLEPPQACAAIQPLQGGVQQQQTPLKQVRKAKKSLSPAFKSDFNETPRLKIPMQRKASLDRKKSRVGPLDFYFQRETNAQVVESQNANSAQNRPPTSATDAKPRNANFARDRSSIAANGSKPRNTNSAQNRPPTAATDSKPRNANFARDRSPIAATCSKPVACNAAAIFYDDDDELLANFDFDVDGPPTVAAIGVKESQQNFPQFKSEFEKYDRAYDPPTVAAIGVKESQQNFPQFKSEVENRAYDLKANVEPPPVRADSQRNASKTQSTVKPNCNLNFDLDLDLQSNCNLNFDFDLVGAEKNDFDLVGTEKLDFDLVGKEHDFDFDFDLGGKEHHFNLVGTEEHESKRSFLKGGDDADADV